jgi:hypothetical protein
MNQVDKRKDLKIIIHQSLLDIKDASAPGKKEKFAAGSKHYSSLQPA